MREEGNPQQQRVIRLPSAPELFNLTSWDSAEHLSLARFAFSISMGQAAQIAMAVVTTIMVSQLGSTQLAASGLINSIVLFLYLTLFGVLQGVTPMISTALGSRSEDIARSLIRATFTLTLLLGVPMLLFVACIPLILPHLGQPPTLVAIAQPYAHILAVGVLPGFLLSAARSTLYAFQRSRSAMWIGFAGFFFNAVMNWALAFGVGGMPGLGLVGIAWSGSLTNILMLLMQLAMLRMGSPTRPYFSLHGQGRWFDRHTWKAILRNGVPNGMVLFIETLLLTSTYVMIGWLGVRSLAAHTVAMQWLQLLLTLPLGVGQAAMIRMAVMLGHKNEAGIVKVVRSAIQQTVVLALVCGILLALFSKQAASVFTSDPAVIHYAHSLILLCAILQATRAWIIVLAGMLRACHDISLLSSVVFGYWIVGFGCCYAFAFLAGWGANGIWLGLIVGFFISVVTLWHRLRIRIGRLDTVIMEVTAKHAQHM